MRTRTLPRIKSYLLEPTSELQQRLRLPQRRGLHQSHGRLPITIRDERSRRRRTEQLLARDRTSEDKQRQSGGASIPRKREQDYGDEVGNGQRRGCNGSAACEMMRFCCRTVFRIETPLLESRPAFGNLARSWFQSACSGGPASFSIVP